MNLLKEFNATLQGRKSYLVALLTVVYSVSGYLLGNLEFDGAFQLVLAALGLSTLRAGVGKLK